MLPYLHAVSSPSLTQGPGENDKTPMERLLNVATCGMFFQAGGRIVRMCRAASARRFGWVFCAVGVVATVYHASWGKHFRPAARKVCAVCLCGVALQAHVANSESRCQGSLATGHRSKPNATCSHSTAATAITQQHNRAITQVDYWSIAVSSMLLRGVLVGRLPAVAAAAMAAVIPFKPTLVSTTNFMAVEVSLRRTMHGVPQRARRLAAAHPYLLSCPRHAQPTSPHPLCSPTPAATSRRSATCFWRCPAPRCCLPGRRTRACRSPPPRASAWRTRRCCPGSHTHTPPFTPSQPPPSSRCPAP